MAMTPAQARLAHLVLNRFGLGAKPGAIQRIGADAKAALLAEINLPCVADITTPGLPTYAAACRLTDGDFGAADTIKNLESVKESSRLNRKSRLNSLRSRTSSGSRPGAINTRRVCNASGRER